MVNFSISNYRFKNLRNIEFTNLTIFFENDSNNNFGIFIKSGNLKINNFFILIFIYISTFFFSNNRIFSLLMHISRFLNKVFRLNIQDMSIYIRKDRIFNYSPIEKKISILKNIKFLADFYISNLYSIIEVNLQDKIILIGARIGCFSIIFNQKKSHKIFVRRISIRYRKISFMGISPSYSTLSYKNIQYFKTKFFQSFYIQKSERIINIPGLFYINLCKYADILKISIREAKFIHHYTGVYFSISSFLRFLISVKALITDLLLKNNIGTQRNGIRCDISLNCEKLIIRNDQSNYFDLVFNSIYLIYNSKPNKMSIWTKFSDCFLFLEPMQINYIQLFQTTIEFNINKNKLKMKINLLRYYFSDFLGSENENYVNTLEVPEIFIYSTLVHSDKKGFKYIAHIDIVNEPHIIFLKSSIDKIHINNKEYFDQKEIDLFEISVYLICDMFKEKMELVQNDPYYLDVNFQNGYQFQIYFVFSSNIKVICDFFFITVFIEKKNVEFALSNVNNEFKIDNLDIIVKNSHSDLKFCIVKYNFSCTIQSNPTQNDRLKLLNVKIQNLEVNIKKIIFVKFDRLNFTKKNNEHVISIYHLDCKFSVNFNEASNDFLMIITENLYFEFKQNINKWEMLILNKFFIYQEINRNDCSIVYELLTTNDFIKIQNNHLNKLKELTFRIPKMKLAISRIQIYEIQSLLYTLTNKFKNRNKSIKFEYDINITFLINEATIHFFENNRDYYTTLMSYLKLNESILTITREEIIINFSMKKFKLLFGELKCDNFMRFPFFDETMFMILQKKELKNNSVIYYEFIESNSFNFNFSCKGNNQQLIDRPIKESIYPLLIWDANIKNNLILKFSFNGNIKDIYYNYEDENTFRGNLLKSNKIFLMISITDILNLQNLIFIENIFKDKSSSNFFSIFKVSNIEFKIPPITLILLNSEFEFRERLIFHSEGFKIFKTKNNQTIRSFLKTFQIYICCSDDNFYGEYINIHFINNKCKKIGINFFEYNRFLSIEKLKIDFSLVNCRITAKFNFINAILRTNIVNLFTNLITKFLNHSYEFYHNRYVIRYDRDVTIYQIKNIRQCPNYYNNLKQLSINKLLFIPYLHFYSFNENAKLIHNKFELPLNYGSQYLINLCNSLFYSNLKCKYFCFETFFKNTPDYNFTLLEESNNYRTDLYSYRIGHFNRNLLFFGTKVQIYSKTFKNLNLVFAFKKQQSFSIRKKIQLSEYMEFSIQFLLSNPFLKIAHVSQELDDQIFSSVILKKEFIDFLDILNYIENNESKHFSEYPIFNSNFFIGIECFRTENSLVIELYNIVNFLNFSGTSFKYHLGNNEFDQLSNKQNLNFINNLSLDYIENINYKKDLILVINLFNYNGKLIFNLQEISTDQKLNFILRLKNNNNKEILKDINPIKFNVTIAKQKNRFYIVIWSSLIVSNMTFNTFSLYILGEKYHLKKKDVVLNKASYTEIFITEELNYLEDYSCFLALFDGLFESKIDIFLDTNTVSAKSIIEFQNNKIIIQIEDYANFIADKTLTDLLKEFSIKIIALKIRPYWIIKNNSQFDLNILFAHEQDKLFLESEIGYFENTSLGSLNSRNHCEYLILFFNKFITNYKIEFKNGNSESIINLYTNMEKPNYSWKMARIKLVSQDLFYCAEYNILVEDFERNICDSYYYILENRTKMGYLLTQTNNSQYFSNTKMNEMINKQLSKPIWDKTFLEKYSLNAIDMNKGNTCISDNFSQKYSIFLPITRNKIFCWGNDLLNNFERFILLEYYDKLNELKTKIALISCNQYKRKETKYIKFMDRTHYGKLMICQLSVTVIRIRKNILHFIFHDLSLKELKNTIFSFNSILSLYSDLSCNSANYDLLEYEIQINIDKIHINISDDRFQPKKNFMNVNMLYEESDYFGLFPIFTPKITSKIYIKLEMVSLNIKKLREREFGTLNSYYKVSLLSNKTKLLSSNDETTIFKIINLSDRDESIYMDFRLYTNFKPIVKTMSIFSIPKSYQIWDLNLRFPLIKFHLKIDSYFKQLIQNCLTRNQFYEINGIFHRNVLNEQELNLSLFTGTFIIGKLIINNKIELFDFHYLLDFPLKLKIDKKHFVTGSFKHLIKKALNKIIKSIIYKNLNSIINLGFLK